MTIQALVAVCPPPDRPRGQVDWGQVENDLGTRLPSDYREIVEVYGSGTFNDFLYLFIPNAPYGAIELTKQPDRWRRSLGVLRDAGMEVPYPIEGDEALVSIGLTDDGDVLYLHPVGEDPDRWPLVVHPRHDDEWYEHPAGLADFLARLLSGTVRPAGLPNDFGDETPQFVADEESVPSDRDHG